MKIKCFFQRLAYLVKFLFWRMFIGKSNFPVPKNINIFSDNTNIFSDNTDPINSNVIFIGDSITYLANWSKAFPEYKTCNFGIGGDTTEKVIKRIHLLNGSKPSKIFLRIGINDLQTNMIPCEYKVFYKILIYTLMKKFPETEIYLMSLLPVTDEYKKLRYDIKDRIIEYNSFIRELAYIYDLDFIYDYPLYLERNCWGNKLFFNDGIHPSVEGYKIMFGIVSEYMDK